MKRLVLFSSLLLTIILIGAGHHRFVFATELVCPSGFIDGINKNTGSFDQNIIDSQCPGVMNGGWFSGDPTGIRPNGNNGKMDPKTECCRNFGMSGNEHVNIVNTGQVFKDQKNIIVILSKVEASHINDWKSKICPYSSPKAGYSDAAASCPPGTDVTNKCCRSFGTYSSFVGKNMVDTTIYSVVNKVSSTSQQSPGLCCPVGWSDNYADCEPNGKYVENNGTPHNYDVKHAKFFEGNCCKKIDEKTYLYPTYKRSCDENLNLDEKQCCPAEGAPWSDSRYACGNGKYDGATWCCHNIDGKKNIEATPKIMCSAPGAVKPNHSDDSTENKQNQDSSLSMDLSETKGTVFCDGKGNNNLSEPIPDDVRVFTAFGCVPADVNAFIKWLLPYLFGISGGISFLLMVFGFIRVATSSGDPKVIEGAKETITSAMIGLIVSIFSLFILKLILVGILKIPGLS